jgi:polysaccharide chain length determinant protein (PEP-CTERM system associated)
MQQLLERLFDELHSSWRFRWWALLAAGSIAVLGWLVVFALPDRYEADASVFVDTRTALKPVLQGLTVGQDVDTQLNYVRQSLLAGDQLRKLATQTGVLAPSVTDPVEQDEALTGLADRVVISVRGAGERGSSPDKSGSVYSIAYRDSNRARSLRVVQALLDSLIQQTLGGKRDDAESAQKFLEAQIKNYDQRLRTAEDRLAEFKKKNIGLMPTEQGGSFAQLQGELDLISKTQTDLSIAVSRRAELLRQLRGEAVNSASGATKVVAVTGVAYGSDTTTRINEAQAKLDELLLRFTERHPDVIAARQTLEELKHRRAVDIETLKKGDANAVAASGAGSSPVFQSIQLALNQTEVDIATMRGALAQHQAKAADLRKRLDTLPKVEAEYAQLNRDYDVNKSQYTALLSNYEKAKLGEQADNAGSVRFDIVQPPTAGLIPAFPRRGLFLTGVLLLALVTGGGVAYLLSLFQPVVGSAQSLAKLTGLPVLGNVGSAFPKKLRTQVRSELISFVSGAAVLFAAFVLAVLLSQAGYRIALSMAGKV